MIRPLFLQPFPRREYTPAEGQRSLEALGLCPSTSLVVSDQRAKEGGGAKEVGGATSQPKSAPEPMEIEEEGEDQDLAHSDNSGSDSDSDTEHGNQRLPHIPPIGIHRPPWRGPPQGGQMFNPFNPAADETFGGQGHRLGGREGQVVAGDNVRRSQIASQAGQSGLGITIRALFSPLSSPQYLSCPLHLPSPPLHSKHCSHPTRECCPSN